MELSALFAEHLPLWRAKIGIVAGLLAIASYVPYIISVCKKRTCPSRTTWWILTGATLCTLKAYSASGDGNALWVAIGDVVGILVIALLSISYGTGGKDGADIVCFVGSTIGMLLWWMFDSPVVGLVTMLLVDGLAIVPTVTKTYQHPEQEDRLAWVLYAVGHLLSVTAIEDWTIAAAIYPIYHSASGSTIVVLTLRSAGKRT